jgi:hypothetical protein
MMTSVISRLSNELLELKFQLSIFCFTQIFGAESRERERERERETKVSQLLESFGFLQSQAK